MKKVLLIGNGAREHAIAEALVTAGASGAELFVVGKTKNPGIFGLLNGGEYLMADVCDKEKIKEFAVRVRPDFAIVGPEAPIAAGIVDMLLEIGVHSASPLQTVGRLESSKSFTRDLLAKYGIPGNPKFKVFYNEDGLSNFFDQLGHPPEAGAGPDFVVKADGLKGGKGVKVSGDHLNGIAEGLAYARGCLADGGRVVVEEKLIGQEFSLMSFCDGSHTAGMPIVQDHKRAYDGDKGPNTGGMGTYSDSNHSLPFLKTSDIEEAQSITQQVAKALFKETGAYFKGVMYGGFIAVKDGVRLIEYNARFGDPEAMNVLPIMKTNFVDVCKAIIRGELGGMKVEFENKATVCKYVVPEGYPDNPVKGVKIEMGSVGGCGCCGGSGAGGCRAGGDCCSGGNGDCCHAGGGGSGADGCRAGRSRSADSSGVLKTYFASVDARDDGLYLAGSRAIAMVGIADTIAAAEKLAQAGVESVKGPVFYRRDIGTKELIDKRIEMMKDLRK